MKHEQTDHIFITSIGRIKDDAMKYPYQIQGNIIPAILSPLAMLDFLENKNKPNRIIVMVTSGAEESWEKVYQEAQPYTLEKIQIPDGKSEIEINEILNRVADQIPDNCHITLDVTHGFRHFPFILYALALYLRSLKNIEIIGAYYGMLEGFNFNDFETPRPILDLQPLLELPEWFYAIRMFRETGSARALAQLMDHHASALEQQARLNDNDKFMFQQATPFKTMYSSFEDLTYAYESGMPIELDNISQLLNSKIESHFLNAFANHLPLANALQHSVTDEINQFSSSVKQTKSRPITESELQRQAVLIEKYLERKQLTQALGLMREWVVSWVLYQKQDQSAWLQKDNRYKIERQLGLYKKLVEKCKTKEISLTISDEIIQWGQFWDKLTTLRNALHHHGMNQDNFKFPPKNLSEIKQFMINLNTTSIEFPSFGGEQGRLLLCPQGMSPGVLYSAIKNTKPDRCIVVCTFNSKPSITEVIQKAHFNGEYQCLTMTNHNHYSKAEIKTFKKQSETWLVEADEVIANLTGGTTCMGIVVQQLVEHAKMLNRPTRRCILIDDRPPDEQRLNPYITSEIGWIVQTEGETDE